MAYQYPLNGGRINASVGGNSTSAGAGYQLVSTGTLTLAGGNNITLSQNGPAITISGANIPSQTTYQFSNSNGVSFGTNGSTITATVATDYAASNHSHGNPTLNLTNLSGTTASASNGLTLSLSAPAVSSLSQTGIISLSQNGNTISIGAPAFSAGIASNSIVTNQVIFSAGNNISLSQSTNTDGATIAIHGTSGGGIALANSQTLYSTGTASILEGAGAITIGSTTGQRFNISVPQASSLSATGALSISTNGNTISIGAPTQSVQTQGLQTINLGGNTAGAMASISSGAMSLFGGNNITLSQNANSVTISGAAGGGGAASPVFSAGTASASLGSVVFSNSNGVSFGLNGSTITASAGGGGDTVTMDYYQNMDRGATATLAVPFANSLMFQRLNQENDLFAGNITANTVLLNMTGSINATVTTAHTVSAYIGIYTDNATNLSLLNSASTSWGLAGGNNTSVYNGPRWLSFVSSQWSAAPVFSQGGDYVFGILMKSSSYAPPLSYYGQNYMLSNQRSGYIGTTMATNTSMAHGNFWNAVMATASLPSSVHSTQVNRNNASAIFMPHIILNNRYSSL